MTLYIRKATSADSVLLNTLGNSIYPAHFKHLWKSESEMNDYLKSEFSLSVLEKNLTDKNTCWFIAENEQPMGYVKLTWEATIPDTDLRGTLLNKLYLAPSCTNQHYGQQIISRVIDLARSQEQTFLWLEVLEQNERACRFYEKQGMRFIKEVVFETASQRSVLKVMGTSI